MNGERTHNFSGNTEDRVKYVGEINYLLKSDSTKTFIVTIHLT
jgi:hypothetical protein